MELKKGYKYTEAGVIPEDWEVKELKEICTPSKKRINPITSDRNYKCIELEHLSQGSGILLGYANSEDLKSQKSIFETGDVLFGKLRPYLRKFLLAKFDGVCTTEIWVLKSEEVVFNEFLYQLVQSERFIDAANLSTGTKMPRAEWKIVSETKIPIPPTKAEQTAIATALSDMDNLISGLEKLIEKKKAIKQGAMQELLRPKEGWVVKRLGDLGEIIGGGTPSSFNLQYWNGSINWFTPTEVGFSKYLTESNRKITKAGLDSSSARILPNGAVLLTTRAGIGDVGILKSEAATNQGFQSVVVNDKNDNEYVYYLLTTLKSELLRNASGSTFLEISPGKLKSIEICLPVKSEQCNISRILCDIDNEIVVLKNSFQKYKLLKQGMMQELLTGKTRLV